MLSRSTVKMCQHKATLLNCEDTCHLTGSPHATCCKDHACVGLAGQFDIVS